MKQAIPCAYPYKGKRYFKFTVEIRQSALEWERSFSVVVTAPKPEDAIEWVRGNVPLPVPDYPAEWVTLGPKGGRVHRYSGWFTTIGKALWRSVAPAAVQLPLPF